MEKVKTYSEEKFGQLFDWNLFLYRNDYSEIDLKRAAKKAGSWVTCACGTQCSIIPRNEYGVPLDEKLRTLGTRFSYHVSNMNYFFMTDKDVFLTNKIKATEILDEIEERSKQLLNG